MPVAAVLLLALCGCDRFRHELRAGHLAEVAAPRIVLYRDANAKPMLSISNETAHGTCVVLSDLEVTIDGVRQTDVFTGGRSTGQTKGDFLPVQRTDWCDAAHLHIELPDEPSRTANEILVRDGSAELRAVFPNVLSETRWVTPPPASMKRASKATVRLWPPVQAGATATDKQNYLQATLGQNPNFPLRLTTRPDGAFDLEIPATTAPGKTVLRLGHVQSEIGATECSASHCSAAQQFVLSADIEIE